MISKITTINSLFIFLTFLLGLCVPNCECRKLIDKKTEKFVSIVPGLFFAADDDTVKMKFNLEELFTGRSLTSRQEGNDNNDKKKPKILQRIVGLVMMIPLVMQVLSLPGALASIKMSLLKSLIMGKISFIILLYCLIKHFRSSSNVVMVQKPAPPQHFNHYYSSFNDDDDDERWFG